jgi:hypothetical protein
LISHFGIIDPRPLSTALASLPRLLYPDEPPAAVKKEEGYWTEEKVDDEGDLQLDRDEPEDCKEPPAAVKKEEEDVIEEDGEGDLRLDRDEPEDCKKPPAAVKKEEVHQEVGHEYSRGEIDEKSKLEQLATRGGGNDVQTAYLPDENTSTKSLLPLARPSDTDTSVKTASSPAMTFTKPRSFCDSKSAIANLSFSTSIDVASDEGPDASWQETHYTKQLLHDLCFPVEWFWLDLNHVVSLLLFGELCCTKSFKKLIVFSKVMIPAGPGHGGRKTTEAFYSVLVHAEKCIEYDLTVLGNGCYLHGPSMNHFCGYNVDEHNKHRCFSRNARLPRKPFCCPLCYSTRLTNLNKWNIGKDSDNGCLRK